MSFTAGIVFLCVCLARLLLRRAPAVLRYALWAVVLFRLLCPVSFESALALLPTGSRARGGGDPLRGAARRRTPHCPRGRGGPRVPAWRLSRRTARTPCKSPPPVGAAVWAAGGAGMLLAGVLSLRVNQGQIRRF